jgi:hypothetical protein
MERTRATWTDERLDDLSDRVSDGFNRVDRRFASLEARIDGRFESLEARVDARFESLERRIDGLQRLMIQFGGATMVAILATLLSVLATRA